MSFRKRNIGLSSGSSHTSRANPPTRDPTVTLPESTPGVRPSPDDGRPTTSTGTPSLDSLLAGHAGLPLGKILFIEENETTDFAGTLLRYYAAEGVVQDHKVHVIGVGEQWGRNLPGLIGPADSALENPDRKAKEKMKIAWRYERLGGFVTGIAGSRASAVIGDKGQASMEQSLVGKPPAFCHAFDLTKRLMHPSLSSMEFIPLMPARESPFSSVHKRLVASITSSPTTAIHRIVIPSLLNPAIYPPEASQPEHLLQFLHSLRALMNTYANRVTSMMSLPLFLYSRSSGLVRWVEILSDGVIELCPFPHSADSNAAITLSRAATANEEPPQGILKIHRLPVLHERGGGSDRNIGEDWAFTVSRRKFDIKPFSLPPAEDDREAQQDNASGEVPRKTDLDF
ncbi:Elongator complex protein 4 [Elaphomyces granulatus]